MTNESRLAKILRAPFEPTGGEGKLWVMFFTSLLLVSGMNFYAVIREPDMIEIEDIQNFPRETVKIEGILTSYVRDPYGEQANRIDLQVASHDGNSVIKIRWNVDLTVTVPPIGSVVTIEGEVSEWNGRIWLQSNGYGAITAKEQVIQFRGETLVHVAQNPSNYANQSLEIEGYLSEALSPNVTYQSLSLMDNPAYGNSDHLLYMQVEGRLEPELGTIEAGSHVIVSGWLQYDERSLRWRLIAQATSVEVLNYADPVKIKWDGEPYMLTYDVGKMVIIDGTASFDGTNWWLLGPTPTDRLCLLASPEDISNNIDGISDEWTGRLVWATDEAVICLDRGQQPEFGNPHGQIGDGATNMLDVAQNPFGFANQNYTFEGWITDPISPDYDKGYVGDGPDYYSRNTKLRIHLIGEHVEWIEADQLIRFNATVIWSESEGRIILEARSWTLGDTPEPTALNWGDGYDSWRWEVGKLVSITGEAVTDEDGNQWVNRSGSIEQVCLLGDGSESSQQENAGEPLTWIGRLTMADLPLENTIYFCLDVR
ncbi:MAG: hypothetical protein HOK23_00195 [Euryarchaeota archaeon]|jgi:hypothetical protein|nr:hypothetical protein [Euryarchaeota archaeon]MBT5508146.1 hypothetical protein [Euryarchaeota archaeon]